MLNNIATLLLVPLLFAWALMAALWFKPKTYPWLIFNLVLIFFCTIVVIGEIFGRFHYSARLYMLVLYPLGGYSTWRLTRLYSYLPEYNFSPVQAWRRCSVIVKSWLLVWILILAYLFVFLILTAPGHGPDAHIYHLPAPMMWITQQSINIIPHVDLRINYLPHAMELFYGFYFMVFQSWRGVELVNLFVGGIIFPLGLYLLLKSFSVRRNWAIVVALTSATVSVNMWQMYEAYVDVPMTVFLVGASAVILNKRFNKNNAILAGLSGGVALAIKSVALFYLIPLFILILLSTWKLRRPIGNSFFNLTIFAFTVFVVGGGVYIENWIVTGNPVYPVAFNSMGISFPGYEPIGAWNHEVKKGGILQSLYLSPILIFSFLFGYTEMVLGNSRGFGISVVFMQASSVLVFMAYWTRAFPRRLITRCLSLGVLLIFVISFLPYGVLCENCPLPYSLRLYQDFIYSLALIGLVVLFVSLDRSPIVNDRIRKNTISKLYPVLFLVFFFYFLLVANYALFGQLYRFSVIILILPPCMASSLGLLISEKQRNLLAALFFMVSVISILTILIVNPTHNIESRKIIFKPLVEQSWHLKEAINSRDYMKQDSRKFMLGSQIEASEDIIAVVVDGGNLKYLLPDYNRIVYLVNPDGPHPMDAHSVHMPAVLRQKIIKSAKANARNVDGYDYANGISYIEYLSNKTGVTKLFLDEKIPAVWIPESWELLEKTQRGEIYLIKVFRDKS